MESWSRAAGRPDLNLHAWVWKRNILIDCKVAVSRVWNHQYQGSLGTDNMELKPAELTSTMEAYGHFNSMFRLYTSIMGYML